MSDFEMTPEEIAAVAELEEAAARFTDFCIALVPLARVWNYGSVYNLLITWDSLCALAANGELQEDSAEVLARLARKGDVPGPYDDEGFAHQGVADELALALESLKNESVEENKGS